MSLVAFKARNHPQQPERDDVNDRRTPEDLFAPLHAQYSFTVDVAASDRNARLPRYYTRRTNGLLQSWGGERVWCNPPYSDLTPWVAKAWTEMTDNGCELVVMLLPANRTEQSWWCDMVEPFRDGRATFCGVLLSTRFLRGRIRFGMPEHLPTPKGGWRCPFGSVVLTWERA